MADAGWLALSSKVGLLCVVPPADRSQATAACNERCESRCRLTAPRARLLAAEAERVAGLQRLQQRVLRCSQSS
jgi:hypothetical protein